jgi:hypothetical protein
LTSREKGGLKVRITLPFHTIPEHNGTELMK